jgi:hypothetical protein
LKSADKFDDITFLHSSEQALKDEMKGAEVTLFKSFDEKVNNYEGDFTLASLIKFIDINSIPTIMGFDQKAAEMIF